MVVVRLADIGGVNGGPVLDHLEVDAEHPGRIAAGRSVARVNSVVQRSGLGFGPMLRRRSLIRV
jgi:hypothetical protein